jgi:hypothetical protein
MSTGATVVATVPDAVVTDFGVEVGLAFNGVSETVNVLLLPALTTLRIQYNVPAVRVPMLVAVTKGIPAIIPKLVKFAEVVTSEVDAVVFVIVMTACALAIFSGLPICFLLMKSEF